MFAFANAPAAVASSSAQDQYLEQIPSGGGNSGTGNFGKSIGTHGGPLTRTQVVKLAEKNAEKRSDNNREPAKAGGVSVGVKPLSPPEAPSSNFLAAAKYGPFGPGPILAVFLIIVSVGVTSVTLRTRGDREKPSS